MSVDRVSGETMQLHGRTSGRTHKTAMAAVLQQLSNPEEPVTILCFSPSEDKRLRRALVAAKLELAWQGIRHWNACPSCSRFPWGTLMGGWDLAAKLRKRTVKTAS